MKSKTQDPLHTTLRDEGALDEYVLTHSDPEPEYLYRLWRETNVRMLHGRMASGRLQGRMLKMFVQMIRPRTIVEVGTFSGYSALCMAEGLSENSKTQSHEDPEALPHLYTFEINDEQEDFTRPWLENSPWADFITFIIGDAITEVPKLFAPQEDPAVPSLPLKGGFGSAAHMSVASLEIGGGMKLPIDLAFLDGDKRTYCETYEMLIPLMSPGAFILADNTLWDGHVTDPAYDRDHQTQGIRRFNDLVVHDPRVTRVIIPLRDGLTVIRKL